MMSGIRRLQREGENPWRTCCSSSTRSAPLAKKAKAWLDAHGVAYADRHIVEDNPTSDELAAWHAKSGLPLRRFFNTSGMLYRERNVKALLDAGMSDADAYALLAENGMMVKRPLVVGDDFVLVGFKEAEWERALL